MHLLATTSGIVDGAAEAVDLKQIAGDIVILSAADSELAALARAVDQLPPNAQSVRLANLLHLQHNYSVDLYVEQTLSAARLIIVRLLGGASYWQYGLDSLVALARDNSITLVVLPGGSSRDDHLLGFSTVPAVQCERLRQYLAIGGHENTQRFLNVCLNMLGGQTTMVEVLPLNAAGLYYSSKHSTGVHIGIVFYKSLIDGGQTAPVDALCMAMEGRGLRVTALSVASLKDTFSADLIQRQWQNDEPDVILNATSFAVGNLETDPLGKYDCPVLQVAFAGSSEEDWNENTRGLLAKDLAMSVVLPEMDGRIFTRAVSFKADQLWHERTQCRIVTYKPVPDRIDHVADLVANWAKLRTKQNSQKRVAIVLANYPNKNGRVANGVGYDTPASTVAILTSLKSNGFGIAEIPIDGNSLMELLLSGMTNDGCKRMSEARLSALDYSRYYNDIPRDVQTLIEGRWGSSSVDPFYAEGEFHLPVILFGNVAVGIQPARGYNIDPKATYHDPALPPPHGYLAFYFWLRHHFCADAIIHNGKHGNLEWLPGKATALSISCLPEVILGPVPQFYPFIVNDPGEGTQAKRRTSAVIIDHLTPPLTRAESYGPLKDLEALVDEYYLASGLDKRRLASLKSQILDLTRASRLDKDAGFTGDEDADLQKLDSFLCDLKEAQIRDGLHVLGTSPSGPQEADLLVALTRIPRGLGEAGDQSLIRALASDFGMAEFDPLDCDFAETWHGPRPQPLQAMSDEAWRSNGDTVERLELYAAKLLEKVLHSRSNGCIGTGPHTGFEQSGQVLAEIRETIHPKLKLSGPNEMDALLRGLSGRSVLPGPSGAPTRGRLDVLPTGRNFYSIDSRSLPTPTAWELGRKSADALLMRHLQDTGEHLQTAALSVWGTSNMRTGGMILPKHWLSSAQNPHGRAPIGG